MPFNPANDEVTWDTVQIPLSRGIDRLTTPRAVAPDRLLDLVNGWMPRRVGVESRRGHVSTPVRTTQALTPRVQPVSRSVEDQLLAREPTPAAVELPSDGSLVFGTSSEEGPDLLVGLARRDSEVVGWSGWTMHGLAGDPAAPIYSPGNLAAVMPAARTRVVSKYPWEVRNGDTASTERIEVVLSIVGRSTLWMSIYDATTGAPYLVGSSLFDDGTSGSGGSMSGQLAGAVSVTPSAINGVRAIAVGGSVYIGVHYDHTDFVLYRIVDTDPTGPLQRPWAGDAAVVLSKVRNFDMRQVTGDVVSLVYSNAVDNVVSFKAFNSAGTEVTTYGFYGADAPDVDLGEVPNNIIHSVHPETGQICLVNGDQLGVTEVFFSLPSGIYHGTLSAAPSFRMALAPRYSPVSTVLEHSVWDFWYDVDDSTAGVVGIPNLSLSNMTGDTPTLIRRSLLAGSAFRSGDRTFVTVFFESESGTPALLTYQNSYFLMDVDAKPVGRLEYGTADRPETVESGGIIHAPYLPSVNMAVDQDTVVNPRRFHSLVFSKTRVDSPDNDQFDEASAKRVDWQTLPRLRSAQFGRSTYFPGAMLHSYDGHEVAEAQHLTFPIVVSAASTISVGGAMVAAEIYRYRVYAVYKDAQGQEILSAALLTDPVTVGAGDDSIVVTIATSNFTRREHVYFLVFRNQSSGTAWNLVSSRDPAGAPFNDTSVATVTFTDLTASAANIAHELDPANTGILANFAPPASEVIGSGRDRLWLAGGETVPGSIQPSLLYREGSGASFSGFLTTAIDRGNEPITGFAFMNLTTLVFKGRTVFAMESAGPNNFTAGTFDAPRVIAGLGALSQESIKVSHPGTFFQSEAGFKLLTGNMQLLDVGAPILDEGADATVTGVVEVPRDQNIRWYTSDGHAYVLDTSSGDWARWSGLESSGAVSHPVTNLAVLAKVNGYLWLETDALYTDAGRGFSVAFRTAWFGGPGETFQRLRRLAINGDLFGPHVLQLRLFFDDNENPVDEWTWDPYDDLNDSTWGDATWGAGVWGDTGATWEVRSSVYALRRRVKRQKCARFSLEVSTDSPGNAGAGITAVTAEVARKPGINRLGARTFGSGS